MSCFLLFCYDTAAYYLRYLAVYVYCYDLRTAKYGTAVKLYVLLKAPPPDVLMYVLLLYRCVYCGRHLRLTGVYYSTANYLFSTV